MRIRDRWQNLVWLTELDTDIMPGCRTIDGQAVRFPAAKHMTLQQKLETLSEVHQVSIELTMIGMNWTVRCVPALTRDLPTLNDLSIAYSGLPLDSLLYACILDYEHMAGGAYRARTSTTYTERVIAADLVTAAGKKGK